MALARAAHVVLMVRERREPFVSAVFNQAFERTHESFASVVWGSGCGGFHYKADRACYQVDLVLACDSLLHLYFVSLTRIAVSYDRGLVVSMPCRVPRGLGVLIVQYFIFSVLVVFH